MSTIGPLPAQMEGDIMASSGVFTQNVKVLGTLQADGFKSAIEAKTMDPASLTAATVSVSYTSATTPSFTYANILNGLFVAKPVGSDSLTFLLPTAASFMAGLRTEALQAVAGDTYAMDVFNAGTNIITFATNTGVSVLTNTSPVFTTAAPGSTLKFVVTNPTLGSEAYTVYRV